MKKTSTLLGGLLLLGLGAQAQALTGTVTVGGTNPTYPTLTAAVAALQTNGVGTGGVTVAVRPGTYAERIALTTLTGSSATNRVRFVGRGGVVTLRPVGTSATTDAAVSITACSFITLDSINVVDGGTLAADQIETGYLITGTATQGSTNITVSNCSILLGGPGPVVSTNLRGVYLLSVATAASGANNNNRILNVQVDKAATGVRIAGSTDLFGRLRFADTGNEVRGCVLGSRVAMSLNGGVGGASSGISVGAQRQLVLAGNRIDSVVIRNINPSLPVSASGINIDNATGRIENNRISHVRYAGQGSSLAQGIRASILANDTLKIFNNFISGIQRVNFTANTGPTETSIHASGIWILRQDGGGGLTQAFHNTIVLPAEPTAVAYPSAGFYLSGGSTGRFPAELINNIIINRKSTVAGQNAFAIVDGNTPRGSLTSNHNLLLAPGTNGAIGQTGRELGGTRVTLASLADWRTGSVQDANSVSKPVNFVGEATGDLRLAGTSVGDRDLGSPRLRVVLRDIVDNLRGATTYKGAFEAATPLRSATARAAQLALQAYPNPTADQLTLQYDQTAAGVVHTTVFDALGRPVRRFSSGSQAAGAQQHPVDLSGLATGVYLVQVAAPGAAGAVSTTAVRVSVVR